MDTQKRRRYWREQKRRWRDRPATQQGRAGRPRLPETEQRRYWREQKAKRRALLRLL